jgi:hypothetical protein
MIVVSGISYIGTNNMAFAVSNQLESHTVSGSDLNNNPMVAKILAEIEYSKKQIADLQKNQKDQEQNKILIAQQRLIADQLRNQAYQILQLKSSVNSSDNAYDRFLNTVQDNDTKLVFHDQFAFTKQRVAAGHIAMQKVLANGGTYEEAMQEFSKYAAIRYTEMISYNQQLNDKYIHHTVIPGVPTSIPFNQYGKVPDDYIKYPSTSTNNAKTS